MNVPPDQISAQLERILASPGFASADRASRFLRFVVERTVAGEGDQLKEYVIGREVFDRGDDYDPRLDSIVRVEAGRLRSKIDEYYAGPGKSDGVLIHLRRGSYAPAIEPRMAAAPAPQPASQPAAAPVEGIRARSRAERNVRLLAGIAMVLALAGSALALAGWRPGIWALPASTPALPTIAVLPFANYSASPAEELLAARATDGVTSEMARLGTLGVVSHTSALQYADVRPRPALKDIASALNAQFILEGTVRDDAGRVTIQVVLVDGVLDRKLWVHDVAGTASDIPEMQRQIAQATSAAITQRLR